jgi:RimJ/RimL family protein N-acetyltransferase
MMPRRWQSTQTTIVFGLGCAILFPHPYTIDDANEFLQRATTEHPRLKFCVDINGEAAGGIGIRIGSDVHRYVGRLGYWLGEPFWGHGIMSEVVGAFTEFSFNSFSLQSAFRRGLCE